MAGFNDEALSLESIVAMQSIPFPPFSNAQAKTG
jgi:hypothetical protein